MSGPGGPGQEAGGPGRGPEDDAARQGGEAGSRAGGTDAAADPRADLAERRAEAAADAGRLQNAALWMAGGTAVSRITGLLRIMALAYALGATHLADAYNLANTTPNMLYDIVLGGVLAATFIPVFVDRLATRSEKEAWRAISSIVTVSVVGVVIMTVIFWLLAPEVISAYTAFGHAGISSTRIAQEKAVATSLLRWFVPQVALYGLIALVTALLNTRRRFAAPMWVPIANNIVVIAVLLVFHAVVPKAPSLATAHARPGQLVLLGVGTTAGVLLQALLLLPSLRGIGLGRLRWRWDPRHEAVRTVVRLGGWTFGFVVANQVALYIVLALAVNAGGTDPVSSYTYAYTFMQMPYAVIAVSVMSAVTPDLAERWATGDTEGFKRRLTVGLRATLAVILPAAMGMLVLSRPAVALLLGHGNTSITGTDATAAALAMFSLGLPGFCTYLYVVRVLQAMQRTKVAFHLYLVENGVNVVLALALVHVLGVRGLALALSVSYSVGALAGIVVLRRWLGPLGAPGVWSPLRRSAGATAAMGAVVLVVSNLSGAEQGVGLLLRVGAAVVAGVVVYAGIGALLGGRRRALALLTGEPVAPTRTAGSGADAMSAAKEAAAGLARGFGRSGRQARDGRGIGLSGRRGRADEDRGPSPVPPWSATRQRVEHGPRIRFVPAPGVPGDLGTGAVPPVPGVPGVDMANLPEQLRRIGPIRPVSGRHVRPVARGRPPAPPGDEPHVAEGRTGRATGRRGDRRGGDDTRDGVEAPEAPPGPGGRGGSRRHDPSPAPEHPAPVAPVSTSPRRAAAPSAGEPGSVEGDDGGDDPGERRWIGGTTTPLSPRHPS